MSLEPFYLPLKARYLLPQIGSFLPHVRYLLLQIRSSRRRPMASCLSKSSSLCSPLDRLSPLRIKALAHGNFIL